MRIVLTGGPGGGKTTTADLIRREIGDHVVIVPESATTLFAGAFPRVTEPAAQRSVQRAIFEVQRSLEDIQGAIYPDRVVLVPHNSSFLRKITIGLAILESIVAQDRPKNRTAEQP